MDSGEYFLPVSKRKTPLICLPISCSKVFTGMAKGLITFGLGDVAVFRVTSAWTVAHQRYEDENIF